MQQNHLQKPAFLIFKNQLVFQFDSSASIFGVDIYTTSHFSICHFDYICGKQFPLWYTSIKNLAILTLLNLHKVWYYSSWLLRSTYLRSKKLLCVWILITTLWVKVLLLASVSSCGNEDKRGSELTTETTQLFYIKAWDDSC